MWISRINKTHLFLLFAMGLSLFYVIPLWSVQIPPGIDLPAHLAIVSVIKNLGVEGHILSQHFERGAFPVPNSLFYLIAYIFSLFFNLITVGKIIISLYLIVTPLAFYYFVKSFQQSQWMTLGVFPLLIQWPIVYGFIDYYIGIPLLLFTLGYANRFLQYPNAVNRVKMLLLAYVVYICHIQIFIFMGLGVLVLSGIYFVLRLEKQTLRQTAIQTSSDLLLMGGPGVVSHLIWQHFYGAYYGELSDVRWTDLSRKLDNLFSESTLIYVGNDDAISFVLLIVFIAILYMGIIANRRDDANETVPERVLQLFPLMMVTILFLLYAVLPYKITKWYWFMANRTAGVLMIFFAACIGLGSAKLKWRFLPMVTVIGFTVCTLFSSHAWNKALSDYREVTHGFVNVLSKAKAQSTLAYYPEDQPQRGFLRYMLLHFGQYHTVFNEGPTSFSFASFPGRIIRQRQIGKGAWTQTIDARDLRNPALLSQFDYLLHYGQRPLEKRVAGIQLIARQNYWSLFKISR